MDSTAHDPFFQIISNLLKPLLFASKDNFAHLSAVKDIEPLVQNLCRQALAFPISENNVKELQNVFEGFDSLALEGKKDKIRKALEIIKVISNQWSVVSIFAESRKLNVECYSLDEIKTRLSKISTPLKAVKGIGPKLGEVFRKKGLETVEDILYWLPIRYEDRRQIKKIAQLRFGVREVASGEIMAMREVFYGRRKVFEISMGDGSGFLRLKWFNYRLPLIKKRYKIAQRLVVYGEIGSFGGQKEIIHPDVDIFEKDEELDAINFNAIVPVYSQIGNLHQKTLRKIMRKIVEEYVCCATGAVPSYMLKRYGLMELPNALAEAHKPNSKFPTPNPELSKGWLPKKSLVFDELFCLEIGLALKKGNTERESGIAFTVGTDLKSLPMVENFKNMLPFELTTAQERVVSEIKRDMAAPHPMNRLIQGDVGSGKTVVAFIASLIAIENNYQSAIMAPTEILAEQHYLNIHRYADGIGIRIAFLSGSLTKSEKTGILDGIKTGRIDLAIGTHALIQEDVEFKKLGLVIVDEQHRFGVMQRAMLKKKGQGVSLSPQALSREGKGQERSGLDSGCLTLTPDVLVMTATPIPRTLAMTVFGDLDVSVIDELPPGRRPIKTKALRGNGRDQVYKIIRGELAKGRQSYIVYPLIEESEELDLRDATKMAEHLQKDIFHEYKIGLLHGRIKAEEKENIMKAFKSKEINILVSTTVIEVGIDVPNATVMVIEHAERFGLSQLHQLRGRVGRGDHNSYCILLADKIGSDDSYKRLKVMEETNDGFRIAEEDLNIRGPGDFLGTRQSGLPDFRVANLLIDASILQKARDEAFNIIKIDPALVMPEHAALKEIVKMRWKGRMELAQIG
ncbi:MAG: ATP-dependent DNA helicase RecG [Deltaproteobacteria bacterium]|nr:ATP-dependent DNA helicase RecG [Deltaproteobacteria bacterium]